MVTNVITLGMLLFSPVLCKMEVIIVSTSQVYYEDLMSCQMGGPAAHGLQNQYSQMLERKGAFNQNAGNLGRWWTQHPPKTTSEDSARP